MSIVSPKICGMTIINWITRGQKLEVILKTSLDYMKLLSTHKKFSFLIYSKDLQDCTKYFIIGM